MVEKSIVVDYVWQYSRYHGDMLLYCEQINEDVNGFASLILLFNVLESTFKNRLNNFDDKFVSLIKQANSEGIISDVECRFLNDPNQGIRRIRNLLSHANISRFNFRLSDEELLYPFSEKENCSIFYNLVSPIIFNIILKLAQVSFIEGSQQEINVDDMISNLKFEIVDLSAREILKLKGWDDDALNKISELDMAEQYRIAENSSDINVLGYIFEGLK